MPTGINGSTITIDTQDGKLPAYLSRPESSSNETPAVVIIHEYWGLVPHIMDVADRYASQGYVALAPDLYRGTAAKNSEEATKLATSVSFDESARALQTIVDYLKVANFAAGGKIGITGFCFGGSHSFNFACESSDIKGSAIYYASRIPNQEKLAKISAPILLIYGDQDSNVNPRQAKELEANLKKSGKNVELQMYKESSHAFFNDQRPSYNPAAAKDAWQKTLQFFKAYLVGA